jgi:hypothetical protein
VRLRVLIYIRGWLVDTAGAATASSIGAGWCRTGAVAARSASVHAETGCRDQADRRCGVAVGTDNILLDFTDLVKYVVSLAAVGALIIVDWHGVPSIRLLEF